MFTKLSTSWRTSAAGVAGFIAALAQAIADLLNGHEANWGLVVATGLACIGLLFARDQKVTSEEAHGLPPLQKITDADAKESKP